MASRTILSKWIGEYCAPVVVTVATSEAEAICLKNDLLLHELLSSFGHLDGLNTTIRVGNQSFYISDAHIRFERVTELRSKSADLVEELLNKSFEEFDISRIPNNVPELKASPPSAWSTTSEQLVMRSMAFSEYEMLSHPLVILTAVATSDVDHVACMQELASTHHTPVLFSNGQYDPQIHRVFLLLHDATSEKKFDASAILKRLQSKFPPSNTLLLTINSFPSSAPNLQQPDMWSRFVIPKYFPQHAPSSDRSVPFPTNELTGARVLGCRLSMEDFMTLRQFCIDLFNHEIVPATERRIAALSKQVADVRKGMKNVLKNWWRKPRDESESRGGGVKYRCDKVESQILLLADASFMVKDFETAITHYKLVREDFRADKANLHLAHTTLMLAACYMISEPSKTKDLHAQLEALGQILASAGTSEMPHASAYFALLASEMYVHNHAVRAPLESAKILLQAAANLSRYPMLMGLLTDRAAGYFLQAGQTRKYIFHTVFAGNKLLRCGPRATKHAAVCFACSMLVLDKGHWGDLKAKLSRALALDLKFSGREGAQRSLILMLKTLSAVLDERDRDVGNKASLVDVVSVLGEITGEGAWGSILIGEGWRSCLTRQVLLGSLPISPMNILSQDISKHRSEVVDLAVPGVDRAQTAILNPVNGVEAVGAHQSMQPSALSLSISNSGALAEEMRTMLELEQQWVEEQNAIAQGGSGAGADASTLSDKIAEAELELFRVRAAGKAPSSSAAPEIVRVPMGESVRVRLKLTNRLPVELQLAKMSLIMEPSEQFRATETDLQLSPECSQEVVLSAFPLRLGPCTVDSARWSLSDYFSVRQPLRKEGPLLQRSLDQRVNRVRGTDTSMSLEVVAPHALLHISFEGMSAEVLQGQLLKSVLVLRNDGAATACDIFVKLSQPSFVFYAPTKGVSSSTSDGADNGSGGRLLGFYGKSSTVVQLPEGTTIAPGEELRFDAWLRITKPGLQTISLLAAYKALREDGSKDYFGPGPRCRTSFVSIQTRGLPSVGASMRLIPRPSSATKHTLLAEIANFLRSSPTTAAASGRPVPRQSVGQIVFSELLQLEEFADIEDNGVKVLGMLMLGAAAPTRAKTEAALQKASSLLAAPSERVVGCYPVNFDNATGRQGACTWLLSLPSERQDGSDLLGAASAEEVAERRARHQQQLIEVMEQFLCIASCSEQFDRDVVESRKFVRLAALEADNAGPRTISQVRRDRQREAEREEAQLRAKSTGVEDDDDSDAEGGDAREAGLVTISLESAPAVLSPKYVTSPATLADIATNEALGQGVTVALLWACRWEGKIRWGMQSVSGLSVVGAQTAATSSAATGALVASAAARPKNPADYLLVGLHFPKNVTLLQIGGAPCLQHIPVTLTLRSVSAERDLAVELQALDDCGNDDWTGAAAARTDPSRGPTKVLDSALRWSGVTRNTHIAVPANGQVEVHLSVAVTQAGVYDLKRFKIDVAFASSKAAQQQLVYCPKLIAGQCLMEVVNDLSPSLPQ